MIWCYFFMIAFDLCMIWCDLLMMRYVWPIHSQMWYVYDLVLCVSNLWCCRIFSRTTERMMSLSWRTKRRRWWLASCMDLWTLSPCQGKRSDNLYHECIFLTVCLCLSLCLSLSVCLSFFSPSLSFPFECVLSSGMTKRGGRGVQTGWIITIIIIWHREREREMEGKKLVRTDCIMTIVSSCLSMVACCLSFTTWFTTCPWAGITQGLMLVPTLLLSVTDDGPTAWYSHCQTLHRCLSSTIWFTTCPWARITQGFHFSAHIATVQCSVTDDGPTAWYFHCQTWHSCTFPMHNK